MNEGIKKDLMRKRVKRIHFVGIGGIGMSGIAGVLLTMGYEVSGSDIKKSDTTLRLESLGAKIFYGHASSNVGDVDVVVTSTAIKGGNPEVTEAHNKGIPVIPRAEMLAELLKMKFSIAVSGSHGKTTVTSMISTVLAHGGMDPTMVIGGKLDSIGGSNAKLGDGEIIVAEADESDGSFLKLNPSIAVITNIDREHLDYYSEIEEIRDAFLQFANTVPFYGATVLCNDDENIRKILPEIKRRIITYGFSEGSDYNASEISPDGFGSVFSMSYRGNLLGDISLNVPGLFNIRNAMAAIAVAGELGMDFPAICEGIKTYRGVHRRMEIKGTVNDIAVVDDYGHHPTEIKATLLAAKNMREGRVIAVFQPHRYTRTMKLFDEFSTAFNDADIVIVTDIYAAGEKEIEGVSSVNLYRSIGGNGHKKVLYLVSFGEVVDYLCSEAKPGDTVISLGAGDVYRAGEEFLEKLESEADD